MKKRQTNRPHRAALALLAGALAVFVGLGTFREAGWPRQQMTLSVEAGDPATLQGFTVRGWMNGAAGASGLYGSPRLNFRVEDGVLTSEAVLHYRRESDEMYGSWSEPLTVPAADHDRVDAAAVPMETSSTGGAFFLHRTRYGHLYDAETDRLELMGQANFYQGDRYLGSVRLDLGTLKLDEPVTVRAQQYEGEAPTDYHLESGEAVAAVQRTCLEDRQGQKLYGLDMLSGAPVPLLVVSPPPGAGLQRGLYRATELLTDARLNALPADTTVAGQPLRSAATPYGAVELVFPLEAGERIFTSPCPLADGTTALLTCRADNTLRLRVLDASWQLLATTDLEIPAGAEEDMAELRRLRGDEIALQLYTGQPGDPGTLWVLRIRQGRPTHTVRLDAAALGEDTDDVRAAGLDETGRRLLVVTLASHTVRARQPAYYAEAGDLDTGTVQDGFRLQVYDLDTGACQVRALLDTHARQSWRGQAWGLDWELSAFLADPLDP